MKKALYREYRPQTFDEVRDQDHITRVLKNQVHTGNIGHAYLFSGSRGTGKTSTAKIFSRAVNCLNPQGGNPCNECENCRAILEETTMDVVEMDAASNRGIDDIRELRDHVIYPPAQLKYKVYIIDEAHMITNDAFNALLKIMEEPPSHLIFILATTEIEKIPVTILSRLQRYEFKRIDLQAIEENIAEVAKNLNVEISDEALRSIAIAADGAMRDALSLLDQIYASGETIIDQELVDRIIGTVGFESIYRLTVYVFDNRLKEAVSYIEKMLAEGRDAEHFLNEMIEYFRMLLVYKATESEDLLAVDKNQVTKLADLCSKVSVQRILDSIDILIETDQLMSRSDFPEVILEASVVRLVNHVNEKDMVSRLEAVEDKLQTIERWQVPEMLVQNEVREIMDQWKEDLPQRGIVPVDREPERNEHPEKDSNMLEGPKQDEEKPVFPSQDVDQAGPSSEEGDEQEQAPTEEIRDEELKDEESKEGQQQGLQDGDIIEAEPDVDIDQGKIKKGPSSSKDSEDQQMINVDGPTPRNNFEKNPKAWLKKNASLFFPKVEEKASIRREIIGRYEDVLFYKGQVHFIYPEAESFIALVVKNNKEKIGKVLEQLIGLSYDVEVGLEGDLPQIAYKQQEAMSKAEVRLPQEEDQEDEEKIQASRESQEEEEFTKDQGPEPSQAFNPEPSEESALEESDPVEEKLREIFPEDILRIEDE